MSPQPQRRHHSRDPFINSPTCGSAQPEDESAQLEILKQFDAKDLIAALGSMGFPTEALLDEQARRDTEARAGTGKMRDTYPKGVNPNPKR